MPSSEKIIYVESDTGVEKLNSNSGWYKRSNNSINNIKDKTTLEVEKNKTLRVKDSTINLPGVIRFNSTLQQFQGYTDNLSSSSDGWTSFQTFNGVNGKDGINTISEMVGNNVSTDANTFGIFKEVLTETISTSTTGTTSIDNQVENIYTAPAYTYTSFVYNATTDLMDLADKTVTYIPNTSSSYKVLVRNNDIYPPVSYQSHDTIRTLNKKK